MEMFGFFLPEHVVPATEILNKMAQALALQNNVKQKTCWLKFFVSYLQVKLFHGIGSLDLG